MGLVLCPPNQSEQTKIDIFLKPRKTLKKLVKMPRGDGLTQAHRLSPELSAIVGVKEASRAELMKLLWAYLKKNELQCDDNKQFFVPDKKMAKVFGTEKLRGFAMSKHIGAHLLQADGSAQPASKAKPAAKKVVKKEAKKEESDEDEAGDDSDDVKEESEDDADEESDD